MLNRLTIWVIHHVTLFAARTPEQKTKVRALLQEIRIARRGMSWSERREADKKTINEMIKRAKNQNK